MARAIALQSLFIRISKFMNRKQVCKALIFIVISLWLLVHITYTIRVNGDVKDRFVGFYAEKNNTLDALIIGSSPVYPCFSTPMIYGDTGAAIYPLSSNMQRPVATKYIVEEALKSQKPKLLIFEMRMWTASDEDLLGNMAHTREVTDNMKYSINRIKTINAMVSEDDDRLSYYFDIFKYHSNWKTMVMPSQLRTFFYSYPATYKGYIPETDVGPADITDERLTTDRTPMPKEQEEYLRDLLEYVKGKDIPALFVISPYTVSTKEQEKTNYMADIIESYGYDFLDMNQHLDEIGFDGQVDFRDFGTHTNVIGAEKVTKFFENYLLKNYGDVLNEDHRGDARYKSWDKAYEKWLTAYEEGSRQVYYNIDNEIWFVLEDE